MTPPIFKQLTLEQAQAAAAEQGKLVIVDFSAEWCQPCKNMDRTTWVAPEVVEWVNANAVAIQLDGESSPLTQSLSVRAYPTLIVFSGERELDRISGARPAATLLQWLTGLRSGHTELDRLRAAPPDDLSARLSLARTLADKGLDDEALETFAWLWEHCLEIEPAWVGVRSSFLIGALEPLLERSEKARQRFAVFRDAAARVGDRSAFSDFVVLNQALGEDKETLEWLRGASPDQAEAMEIHRDHRILELVEEHGELALFGKLLKDPLAPLEAHQEILEQIRDTAPEDFPKEELERTVAHFTERRDAVAALLANSMRAAGRETDAQKVEARAKVLQSGARTSPTAS